MQYTTHTHTHKETLKFHRQSVAEQGFKSLSVLVLSSSSVTLCHEEYWYLLFFCTDAKSISLTTPWGKVKLNQTAGISSSLISYRKSLDQITRDSLRFNPAPGIWILAERDLSKDPDQRRPTTAWDRPRSCEEGSEGGVSLLPGLVTRLVLVFLAQISFVPI